MNTLYTTKISDYHNLFAVSKTLDEWSKKAESYLAQDPKNEELISADSAIDDIQEMLIDVFPGYRGQVTLTLGGLRFVEEIHELFVAFDEHLKIQGAAVTRRENDLGKRTRKFTLLYLVTDPQNLRSTKAAPKIHYVGASLLKAIATAMQEDARQIPLELRYWESAVGFYKKYGFSCSWYSSFLRIDGSATWPYQKRLQFVRQMPHGISCTEPMFPQPLNTTVKERQAFENAHFDLGTRRICRSLNNWAFCSYEPLKRDEIFRLLPRLTSFFIMFLSPEERLQILRRLTVILCRHSIRPLPEVPRLEAFSFSQALNSLAQHVFKRISSLFQNFAKQLSRGQ